MRRWVLPILALFTLVAAGMVFVPIVLGQFVTYAPLPTLEDELRDASLRDWQTELLVDIEIETARITLVDWGFIETEALKFESSHTLSFSKYKLQHSVTLMPDADDPRISAGLVYVRATDAPINLEPITIGQP